MAKIYEKPEMEIVTLVTDAITDDVIDGSVGTGTAPEGSLN